LGRYNLRGADFSRVVGTAQPLDLGGISEQCEAIIGMFESAEFTFKKM
jgi:hypothetical protein